MAAAFFPAPPKPPQLWALFGRGLHFYAERFTPAGVKVKRAPWLENCLAWRNYNLFLSRTTKSIL
jgi:hypothetical protein